MTPDNFEKFVSPETGSRLVLERTATRDGHVETGVLTSTETGERYAVESFLPRFVPRVNYAQNFGLQWQAHRQTQLDSYTGATYSRDRLLASTGWRGDLSGKTVLEAGCGAGRFTEAIVDTGAEVVSFDFSDAVDANYANNGHRPNVTIFQGDIYNIPLPKGSFDYVICLGVLQHTPDPARSFSSLAAMVRPGGELIVDVYPKRLRAMLHWKYLLRPLTVRLPPDTLYRCVSWYAPKLIPAARTARRVGGRAGHRLIPILDQSDKRVPEEVQRDWTILDTYDALSARYDQPQTARTLATWFRQAGFANVEVLSDLPQACALVGRGQRRHQQA